MILKEKFDSSMILKEILNLDILIGSDLFQILTRGLSLACKKNV